MKFIADVMLGRLARRLRLLGFDVLYDRTLDDNGVIRISLEQGRVILTRDRGLARRPLAANNLFIEDDDVEGQLRQVAATFPRGMPRPLTRCSVCNEPLAKVSREDIKDLVPPHVHETRHLFLRCAACGRVYWTGTHVKRMALGDKATRARKTGGRF